MSRELLKRALDYLTKSPSIGGINKLCNDIESELEKPEPDPICSSCKAIGAAYSIGKESLQQKPLSDEEIEKISNLIDEEANSDNGFEEWANMFARHIEKAHGIT